MTSKKEDHYHREAADKVGKKEAHEKTWAALLKKAISLNRP